MLYGRKKNHRLASRSISSSHLVAPRLLWVDSNAFIGGVQMQSLSSHNPKLIQIENKNLEAAKCAKCGAKMYPRSLLKTHLHRHQRRQEWFTSELKKLQHTME